MASLRTNRWVKRLLFALVDMPDTYREARHRNDGGRANALPGGV